MPSRERAPVTRHTVDDWWVEVEDEVLRSLAGRGEVPTSEIAGTLGVSEAAATSLLSMMAREGKITICLVQAR